MMTLQDRLHEVFPSADRGLQAELARLCKVQPASVNAWFNNGAKAKRLNLRYAQMICAHYAPNISPDWLSDGTLPKLVSGLPAPVPATVGPEQPASNVVAVPFFKAVPLVSWVAAGSFRSVPAAAALNEAEEWLPAPRKHGPRTFALRVRGPSMHNPGGEKSFKDGDIIFVDPDIQAKHKDLVIVQIDGSDEATFKRLLIDGDRMLLEALNPSWPERYIVINTNATILGVVIAKSEIF